MFFVLESVRGCDHFALCVFPRHSSGDLFLSGDHSALRKQRSGDIRHRPSGNDTGLLRHGYVASGLEGGERFPNKRETSEPPAALDKHGVQHRGQVTPEQTLALAKGGVRRGRVVFHRKGVMLSEESPRNVPPVQVKRGFRFLQEPTAR